MRGLRGARWVVACLWAPTVYALPCELLPTVAVDSGKVLAAVRVAGPEVVTDTGQTLTGLPPFCKVSAVATPTADSLINIEVWLPLAGWNGRFQGIGNGGYAGTIAAGAPAMAVALRRGFAVANTDMGTAPSSNNNGDALAGHPQKWEDWGHRATHLMTVIGKQLVVAQYGAAPTYSYFNGCSTGGQQALMTAQRYPADYDGILAGSPANNRTHIHAGMLWNWQAQHATANSAFGSDQAKLVTAAATAACAVRSGGVAGDGFLTDPRTCDWDPGVLQCSSATATGCLSAGCRRGRPQDLRGAAQPAERCAHLHRLSTWRRDRAALRLAIAGARRAAVRVAVQVGVRAHVTGEQLRLRS